MIKTAEYDGEEVVTPVSGVDCLLFLLETIRKGGERGEEERKREDR